MIDAYRLVEAASPRSSSRSSARWRTTTQRAGSSTTRPSPRRGRSGHLHPLEPQQRRRRRGQRVSGALGRRAQKSIREGFGLTVTEALWKGRPTIGGRVGGIVAQIQDGDTGWLVDVGRGMRRRLPRDPGRPAAAERARAARARSSCAKTSSRRGCCATGSRSSTGCWATMSAKRLVTVGQLVAKVGATGPEGKVVRVRWPAEADRRLQPPPGLIRRTTQASACRPAGRRRARDSAAEPRRAHDVTWIASAMTDEDRASPRSQAERRSTRPHTTGRPIGSASSRTTRAATTGSTTSSRTRRSGSSSTTSGTSLACRTSTRASTTRGRRATSRSTRAFADAVVAELDASPRRPSSSTTTTCTSRRGSSGRRRPGARSRTSCTSRGRSRTTGASSPSRSEARSTTACWRTTSSDSTPTRWRRNFLRSCVDIAGARGRLAEGTVEYDGGRVLVGPSSDLGRPA